MPISRSSRTLRKLISTWRITSSAKACLEGCEHDGSLDLPAVLDKAMLRPRNQLSTFQLCHLPLCRPIAQRCLALKAPQVARDGNGRPWSDGWSNQ
jgi:hypothetical protein